MATYHVSNLGAGTHDGLSWANAMTWAEWAGVNMVEFDRVQFAGEAIACNVGRTGSTAPRCEFVGAGSGLTVLTAGPGVTQLFGSFNNEPLVEGFAAYPHAPSQHLDIGSVGQSGLVRDIMTGRMNTGANGSSRHAFAANQDFITFENVWSESQLGAWDNTGTVVNGQRRVVIRNSAAIQDYGSNDQNSAYLMRDGSNMEGVFVRGRVYLGIAYWVRNHGINKVRKCVLSCTGSSPREVFGRSASGVTWDLDQLLLVNTGGLLNSGGPKVHARRVATFGTPNDLFTEFGVVPEEHIQLSANPFVDESANDYRLTDTAKSECPWLVDVMLTQQDNPLITSDSLADLTGGSSAPRLPVGQVRRFG